MMAIDVADKGQSCRLLSAPFAVVVACLHYSPICGYGGGGGRWRTGAERHILFVPCRCSASLSCVIFSPCLSLKNGRKDKDMADGNVGSAGRCGDAGRWRSGAGHMYFNRTIKYVFFYFLFCILCLVGDPCCVCSFVSYLSKGARNDVLCDVACMYSHLFISQSVAGAIVGRLHGVVEKRDPLRCEVLENPLLIIRYEYAGVNITDEVCSVVEPQEEAAAFIVGTFGYVPTADFRMNEEASSLLGGRPDCQEENSTGRLARSCADNADLVLHFSRRRLDVELAINPRGVGLVDRVLEALGLGPDTKPDVVVQKQG